MDKYFEELFHKHKFTTIAEKATQGLIKQATENTGVKFNKSDFERYSLYDFFKEIRFKILEKIPPTWWRITGGKNPSEQENKGIDDWEKKGAKFFDKPKRGKVYSKKYIEETYWKSLFLNLPIIKYHKSKLKEFFKSLVKIEYLDKNKVLRIFVNSDYKYNKFKTFDEYIERKVDSWAGNLASSLLYDFREIPRELRTLGTLEIWYVKNIQDHIYKDEDPKLYVLSENPWIYNPKEDPIAVTEFIVDYILGDQYVALMEIVFGLDLSKEGRSKTRAIKRIKQIHEKESKSEDIDKLETKYWTETRTKDRWQPYYNDDYHNYLDARKDKNVNYKIVGYIGGPSVQKLNNYYGNCLLIVTDDNFDPVPKIADIRFLGPATHLAVEYPSEYKSIKKQYKEWINSVATEIETKYSSYYIFKLPWKVYKNDANFEKLVRSFWESGITKTVENLAKRKYEEEEFVNMLSKEAQNKISQIKKFFDKRTKKLSLDSKEGKIYVADRFNKIHSLFVSFMYEKSIRQTIYKLIEIAKLKQEIHENVEAFPGKYNSWIKNNLALYGGLSGCLWEYLWFHSYSPLDAMEKNKLDPVKIAIKIHEEGKLFLMNYSDVNCVKYFADSLKQG